VNEHTREIAYGQYATAKFAATWMIGTFLTFLTFGDTGDLAAPLLLVLFVSLATAAWIFGYQWGLRTFPWEDVTRTYRGNGRDLAVQTCSARRWIAGSSVYFLVYGLLMLEAYGATFDGFWIAATNPGDAYAAKFELVEQLSVRSGQTLLQVLILLSIFQLALAPLVTYFWSEIGWTLRIFAIVGATMYAAFFFYIGTMQGLGFMLAGFLAGLLGRNRRSGSSGGTARRSGRLQKWLLVGVATGGFALYMINAQSARLETFEVRDRFQANPVVESIAGRDFARGAAVLVHYPTHGYRGLAYNLETPFAWTMGRGSSRAVDSYWEQYIGTTVLADTYPLRTQERTGWQGLQSWATVYPWLASDLTFPGVVVVMAFIGRWTARMWIRSASFHDPLALMLFSQLVLFVIFIPANNQVLISRPALLGVSTCVFLYFAREFVWRRRVTSRSQTIHLAPRDRTFGGSRFSHFS
jgi:hypothetical protein